MTRTLVLANRKGGCGKTTLAVHLAACLAKKERVLLVDFDSQGHAGLCLGFPPASVREIPSKRVPRVGPPSKSPKVLREVPAEVPWIQDVLSACLKGEPPQEPMPWGGLWLYPASEGLADLEPRLEGRPGVLRDALIDRRDFDWIILDTPPSLSPLTWNALAASDLLVIPVKADWLSLVGVAQMMSVYYRVNASVNPLLRLLGVVPAMTDGRTRMTRDVKAELKRNFGDAYLLPDLRMDVKFAEAASYGKSLLEYVPKGRGAEDAGRILREIRRRLVP
jgi:chromosome partitioning protein